MTGVTLGDLALASKSTLTGPSNLPVTGFATDSNSVRAGDLFIAIKGERVDGHDFVPQATERGAVASLVEKPIPGPHLLCENVVHAIAEVGAFYRASYQGPVIGITGSAGKTTTKELVYAALSPLGPVLKTIGNRNTELTSPLIWPELEPGTSAVVVEMAMRGFGQIAHLARIARPQVGVITNIGVAHILQVGSREGVARAKGELLQALPQTGTAVLWQEDEYLETLRQIAEERTVHTFGFSAGASSLITEYKVLDVRTIRVAGSCLGQPWRVDLPAVGRHIALDAAAAILVAVLHGIDSDTAARAMTKATFPPMRMEVKEYSRGRVLLDAYNASPPSMISAIETLGELPTEGRRLALLGEMKELGDETESGHREVGKAVRDSDLDEVLFVGPDMRFAYMEAGERTSWVESTDDARDWMMRIEPGDFLLVKGSRALHLERLLTHLESRN